MTQRAAASRSAAGALSDDQIRAKLLRLLSKEYGGERSVRMVKIMAGGEEAFARVVRPMLKAGELVMRRCQGGRIGLPPRCKQRGDVQTSLIVALGGALLVVAAFGVGHWRGYNAGAEAKQAEWDRQKLADVKAGQDRDKAVSQALGVLASGKAAAESAAATNEARWKEAQREARRNGDALAVCEDTGQAETALASDAHGGGEPAGSGARQDDVGLRRPNRPRLLWRFVGLHDGAFTDLNGQPLFGDSARYASDPARADAASPYGLDELVDVDGENARALSACRRAYFDTLNKLKAAEAAWEKKR